MTHWEVISKSNLFAGGILFWRGGTRDDGWFLDPSRYLQTARFDGTFHFHCNQHDRDHHLQYCFGWVLWDLAVMILSGRMCWDSMPPFVTVIFQLEVGPRGKKCKMVTELLDAKSVPWRWYRFYCCVAGVVGDGFSVGWWTFLGWV